MADKKISELTTASEIKNGDNLELSQDTGSGLVSLKATILAIANKMLKGINFTSDLQTTDKTVIGAINEVAQGGGGGGAGHTILDDDGTALAQEDDLQFKGVYSTDNSEDGVTEVNVYREMTKAEFDLLSDDEKKGFIKTTDEPDIASIVDGVFIDFDNVIQARTTYSSTFSYTATEDCIVVVSYANNPNASAGITIDGEEYDSVYSSSLVQKTTPVYLKKGQTLTGTNTFSGADVGYEVYGIQQGSQVIRTYSETVLWSGTELCNDSNAHPLTLSDDYTNYDAIVIFVTDDGNEVGSSTFLVSALELNKSYLDVWYSPANAGAFFVLTGSKAISVYRISGQNNITYNKIVGIKY